jgi:methylated-DNA-[protein]-cysteine S-methyltransferase
MSVTFAFDGYETPIGRMLIAFDDDGAVRALDWHDYEPRMRRLLRLHYLVMDARGGGEVALRPGALPDAVRGALDAYFAGDLDALGAVPVRTGGTEFQRAVWSGLRAIPAGRAWSYAELAAFLGRPRAVRAVGAANGSNPVGVIVPCHRVIGADRALTGYGGGIERKRWLLRHERATFRDV